MSEIAAKIVEDNDRDNPADAEIKDALSLKHPKSFFLFAGAGSGKTRSLKTVLEAVAIEIGDELRRRGRKVAVITYTNVACEEILRRVNSDPIFDVKTIHSFAWSLIEGRNQDIRKWLVDVRLPADLEKLADEHARGRPGTKAHETRERKIAAKHKRLDVLPDIHSFTYNPNGDNVGRDSLNHEEVIDMTSYFLSSNLTLQNIVLSQYPFILIDESQDTLRPFMEALLEFEATHSGKFALGLFGDTMQRIYAHGVADLADRIPDRWAKPAKVMNHRSRARIIDLANSIRAEDDGRKQKPRSDREGGIVRVFVTSNDGTDRASFEQGVRLNMAKFTSDPNWSNASKIKTLTIEHHMAAARLGFSDLFDPLDAVDRFRTGFRDGTLPSMRLFSERILPVLEAHRSGDTFEMMSILRMSSPLLSKAGISARDASGQTGLKRAKTAVAQLLDLFSKAADPSGAQVLKVVKATGLFEVPDILAPFCIEEFDPAGEWESTGDSGIDAWAKALSAPFSQVARYREYVLDQSPYGTHQGVKGLEFPRVMVVADDGTARMKSMNSYEKLLGAKPKSKNDLKNEAEGKETAFDRTRRLLYVTCTRAEESLALVVYSDDPKAVSQLMIDKKWVSQDEVEIV